MLLYRSSPRIRSSTRLACWARKTAAWPAELPPPTSDHLRAPAHLPFGERRGVVDALPLEALAALDVQPAVVGARGDQEALGGDRLAAVQVQDGSRRSPSPGG